jgi:anti-anti-sigma factor
MLRFSVRTRISGTRFVSRPRGELDGSTACRVLDAVARAPAHVQEIVVDLGEVSAIGSFGLDVLARGIPASARGRPVLMLGVPGAYDDSTPNPLPPRRRARSSRRVGAERAAP